MTMFLLLQMLDLGDAELGWLTRHLGHSRAIHFNYYRGQESSLELTKIAKLLFAVQDGSINKYKGKTLDSISLDGEPLNVLSH